MQKISVLLIFTTNSLFKAGAKLNDAEKATMREINSELAKLQRHFHKRFKIV